MKYKLEFTKEELDVIVAALQAQPWINVNEVLVKIINTVKNDKQRKLPDTESP